MQTPRAGGRNWRSRRSEGSVGERREAACGGAGEERGELGCAGALMKMARIPTESMLLLSGRVMRSACSQWRVWPEGSRQVVWERESHFASVEAWVGGGDGRCQQDVGSHYW